MFVFSAVMFQNKEMHGYYTSVSTYLLEIVSVERRGSCFSPFSYVPNKLRRKK